MPLLADALESACTAFSKNPTPAHRLAAAEVATDIYAMIESQNPAYDGSPTFNEIISGLETLRDYIKTCTVD
jgi:hypothetical protein